MSRPEEPKEVAQIRQEMRPAALRKGLLPVGPASDGYVVAIPPPKRRDILGVFRADLCRQLGLGGLLPESAAPVSVRIVEAYRLLRAEEAVAHELRRLAEALEVAARATEDLIRPIRSDWRHDNGIPWPELQPELRGAHEAYKRAWGSATTLSATQTPALTAFWQRHVMLASPEPCSQWGVIVWGLGGEAPAELREFAARTGAIIVTGWTGRPEEAPAPAPRVVTPWLAESPIPADTLAAATAAQLAGRPAPLLSALPLANLVLSALEAQHRHMLSAASAARVIVADGVNGVMEREKAQGHRPTDLPKAILAQQAMAAGIDHKALAALIKPFEGRRSLSDLASDLRKEMIRVRDKPMLTAQVWNVVSPSAEST